MNINKQIEDRTNLKVEKNTEIMVNIKECSKFISIFSAVLYGLAMGIKNIYYFWYSLDAEQFYGIPRHYFYESIIGDVNIYLILILIFIIILLSPPIIKKLLKKRRISNLEAFGYSTIISMLIFYILLNCAIDIINSLKTEYLNNSKYLMIGIFIIGIISLISFIVYINLFIKEDESVVEENNYVTDKKIKNNAKKAGVVYLFFVLVFTIAVVGAIVVFFSKIKFPTNINTYEVVYEGNCQKKIVVGEYKEFYILMDIIKKEDEVIGSKLVFKKHFYELKRKDNLKIGNLKFEQIEGEEYKAR
jgi:membrane protein